MIVFSVRCWLIAGWHWTISNRCYRSTSSSYWTFPDGKGNVAVCLLVEHKSTRDKFTPVQVGGYIFSGYQLQISQGQKALTPIIPILFYHGRQKWEYWILDRLFDEPGDDLLGFLPNFDYVFTPT